MKPSSPPISVLFAAGIGHAERRTKGCLVLTLQSMTAPNVGSLAQVVGSLRLVFQNHVDGTGQALAV